MPEHPLSEIADPFMVTDSVARHASRADRNAIDDLISWAHRVVALVYAHANQPSQIGVRMVEIADEGIPVIAAACRTRKSQL